MNYQKLRELEDHSKKLYKEVDGNDNSEIRPQRFFKNIFFANL